MTEYPAKIATALHAVMEKCSYVQKKQRNTFHNYTYAGEADLLEVLRPAMIEAGLMLLPSCVERSDVDPHGNTHVSVEYTLVHKDGDVWPDKIRAFGTGNDRAKNGSVGDKGTYKAITGANKYLLFKLFQIETGDDPEVLNPGVDNLVEPAPAKQPEQPRAGAKSIPPKDSPEYAFQWLENAARGGIKTLADAWPTIAHDYKSAPFIAELTARKDELKIELQKRAA